MMRSWRNKKGLAKMRDRANWQSAEEDYHQERALQTFLAWGDWMPPAAPEWNTDAEPEPPAVWKILDTIEDQTLAALGRPDYARPAGETLDTLTADDAEIVGLDESEIVAGVIELIPQQWRDAVAEAYWSGVPIPQHIAQCIARALAPIRDRLPAEWQYNQIAAQTIRVIR